MTGKVSERWGNLPTISINILQQGMLKLLEHQGMRPRYDRCWMVLVVNPNHGVDMSTGTDTAHCSLGLNGFDRPLRGYNLSG
jgi:hypothetical protein